MIRPNMSTCCSRTQTETEGRGARAQEAPCGTCGEAGIGPRRRGSPKLSRRWKRSSPSRSATGYSRLSKPWFFGRTPRTKRCSNRRGERSGRAGGGRAPRMRPIREPRRCSIVTSSRLFTIRLRAVERFPLEAQRLGLEAHASDLNPVAVLINKAMIEIPPRFAGQAPVNPAVRQEKRPDRARLDWERRVWPTMCATTGNGCAARPRSASAICIRRSKSPRRWSRSGPTWNATRGAS